MQILLYSPSTYIYLLNFTYLNSLTTINKDVEMNNINFNIKII